MLKLSLINVFENISMSIKMTDIYAPLSQIKQTTFLFLIFNFGSFSASHDWTGKCTSYIPTTKWRKCSWGPLNTNFTLVMLRIFNIFPTTQIQFDYPQTFQVRKKRKFFVLFIFQSGCSSSSNKASKSQRHIPNPSVLAFQLPNSWTKNRLNRPLLSSKTPAAWVIPSIICVYNISP